MKKITLLALALIGGAMMNAQVNSVGIVGDGAGGWPGSGQNTGPTDIHQMTTSDGVNWTYTDLVTSVGSVKFRANNEWTINWGANAFPTGIGVQDGASIPTGVGVYNVAFNSETGAYTFTSSTSFPLISITGDGVEGMTWGQDTDMTTSDGVHYSLNDISLVNGSVKFRQNHDWGMNWGEDSFPSGTGVQDGASIGIGVPGHYSVVFNRTTGAYAFSFHSIAIVGDGTLTGWPNDPQTDPNVLTTTDGVTYTLANITLQNGGVKFRQDNSWAVNWGTNAFPSGNATQDGDNIPVTAGAYSITFNRMTGAFDFAVLSTDDFGKLEYAAYPNPSSSEWTISGGNEILSMVELFDISGKKVLTVRPSAATVTLDAGPIGTGIYFAKVTTASGTQTLKLVRN